MSKLHKYGMRLRGFSIGCQPMRNLDHVEDDPTGNYWNILYYTERLTKEDEQDYELDYLGGE